MKYLLSHRTSYSYASSVDSAHHIAHLRARAFPGQKVSSLSIEANPAPALAVQHLDHFGNHIDISTRVLRRSRAAAALRSAPSTLTSGVRTRLAAMLRSR